MNKINNGNVFPFCILFAPPILQWERVSIVDFVRDCIKKMCFVRMTFLEKKSFNHLVGAISKCVGQLVTLHLK